MADGGIGGEVLLRKAEEPQRRVEPPAMLRVVRRLPLQLQVDEGPGQLDQPLVKRVIRSGRPFLQPEMLQHIMGLVKAPPIEAEPVSLMTRVVRVACGGGNGMTGSQFHQ